MKKREKREKEEEQRELKREEGRKKREEREKERDIFSKPSKIMVRYNYLYFNLGKRRHIDNSNAFTASEILFLHELEKFRLEKRTLRHLGILITL